MKVVGRRVVEMVRVSTSAQADRGTAGAQRHALDKLRASRPGEILARIDVAVSGAAPIDQRPDIAQLRRIVDEHGGFDELRVWDLDRLSRAESPIDRMVIPALCTQVGAIIVDASGAELDPSTETGELTAYLRTLFARQERHRLRARTIAGRQRAAREGRLGFGGLPWPYVWEDDHVEVDEEGAEAVRRIFSALAKGTLPHVISADLNAEGVPTPFGSAWADRVAPKRKKLSTRWESRRVGHIARTPTYLGHHEQTMGGQSFALPVPPLVDRETWDAAQAHMDDRKGRTGRPRTGKRILLVQGLAYCGVCGQRMYGVTEGGGRNKTRRSIYVCRSRHVKQHGPPCANMRHRADAVDAIVWGEVSELVSDPAWLTQSVDQPEADTSEWHTQLDRCEEELARLAQVEDDWMRLSRRGVLDADALERNLASLATDRATLRRTAEVARKAIATEERASGLASQAAAVLPELAAKVRDAGPEERRELVRLLVPSAPGFGVFLHQDGGVEVAGAIVTPGSGASGCTPKVGGGSSTSTDFGGADVVPFRRKVAAGGGS